LNFFLNNWNIKNVEFLRHNTTTLLVNSYYLPFTSNHKKFIFRKIVMWSSSFERFSLLYSVKLPNFVVPQFYSLWQQTFC